MILFDRSVIYTSLFHQIIIITSSNCSVVGFTVCVYVVSFLLYYYYFYLFIIIICAGSLLLLNENYHSVLLGHLTTKGSKTNCAAVDKQGCYLVAYA